MEAVRIGYARCSTDRQDLSAQRSALVGLGVDPERIYTDHGLTGRTRARPGLDQALAAVRCGDTLVVTKLDRLARSVPDARDIAEELRAREVRLALGPTTYDPTDPMGKMFFNILATFAEFESDLIRLRTREGMAARPGERKAARQEAQAVGATGSRAAAHVRYRGVQRERARRGLLGLAPHRLPHASSPPLRGRGGKRPAWASPQDWCTAVLAQRVCRRRVPANGEGGEMRQPKVENAAALGARGCA